MAYGARLESVLGASPRGFESPILRPCDPSVFKGSRLTPAFLTPFLARLSWSFWRVRSVTRHLTALEPVLLGVDRLSDGCPRMHAGAQEQSRAGVPQLVDVQHVEIRVEPRALLDAPPPSARELHRVMRERPLPQWVHK